MSHTSSIAEQELAHLNKRLPEALTATSGSIDALNHVNDASLADMLQKRQEYAEQHALIAARSLKKSGMVPAKVAFGPPANLAKIISS